MSNSLARRGAVGVGVRTLPARVGQAWRSFWSGPLTLNDPEMMKRLFGDTYQSTAGITVTRDNAFTFSAVFDAVNQISSDVAKMPLNLRKRRQDGGSDLYESANLYYLLKYEPNPEQTSMVFRRTLLAHALTCHGGYAEIERDNLGRPIALWTLTPDRVEVIRRRNDRTGELGPLEFRIDGKDDYIIPDADMFHINGLGYDGYVGYEVINKARQAIGLALAMEKFGATYFGKGTVFGGVLETDADLDENQKADIEKNIKAFRAAQDSAWRILVTGAGHKFTQFASKPNESQFDESRTRQVEEVARFFRMQPYRLGVNTPGSVSYSSVEMANQDYYTGALLDWITLFEQESNRKLIPRLERRQQFVKHNANVFLRGTTKERFDALGIARDKGIINADEWRELEDMNPQEGGVGKLYLVQSAQIPVDKLVEKIDAEIKKANQPPPAPPAPAPAPSDGPTQDQVDQTNARAAAAEQLAAETREQLAEARTALAGAEATGTAQDVTIQELRADVERLSGMAAQMELIAGFVRERSAQLEEARAAAVGELETVTRDRDALLVQAEEARAAAAVADALVTTTRAEAETATGTAAEAHRQLTEATARLDAMEGTSVAAIAARADAEAQVLTLQARALELDAARADAQTRADQAIAAADAARIDAESTVAVLRADIAAVTTRAAESATAAEATVAAARAEADRIAAELVTLQGERAALTDTVDGLRQQMSIADLVQQATLTERTAEMETLRATVERLQAELLQSAGAAGAIEATLAEARAAQAAAEERAAAIDQARLAADQRAADLARAGDTRAASVLSAHRALIVDVMRRMIEREIDRIQRAQATPQKLRAAVETFYVSHEELCVTALLPTVRVHLAHVGSAEDAGAFTRRLAARHVQESIQQLMTVLDGNADDLSVSVTALMHRWRAERVDTIADVLLQRGIDHGRRT